MLVEVPTHYPYQYEDIPLFGNKGVRVRLDGAARDTNSDGSCRGSLNLYELPTLPNDKLGDQKLIDALCPRCGLIIKVIV